MSESSPLIPKEKTTSETIFDFIINGPPPASKTKVPFQWWHAWDVAANTKEIFVRQREGDMAFLDGIRALAYMWVLGDHLYQAFMKELTGFVTWWSGLGAAGNEYQIISNSNKGDQGVTSFFFLSGFLIPFVFTRMVKAASKDSAANDMPIPAFSFHAWEFLFRRYMRLAPTLYAGTLIAFLYGYFMKDVSTSASETFYVPCQRDWWENIFFINNFSGIAGWQDCYDSVWTISVEYQLYILTIPVVYFYCWKEHYGWWAAALWTALTFFIRVAISAWCDDTGASFGAWVYLPSWTRAPEYGVGIISFMLYDYFYCNSKRRAEIKPLLQLPTHEERAWRVAFHIFNFGVLAWGLYYLVSDDSWWVFSYTQYEAFSYFLWAGTLFVVAQIVFDNAFWPIRWVLSWYVWYPIAQLAYTAGKLLHLLPFSPSLLLPFPPSPLLSSLLFCSI
jgi:peptidoglycan/LPS O-acetylase OafA/YrhL